MKHLRLFESYNDVVKIQEFCNDCLIELIDSNWSITIDIIDDSSYLFSLCDSPMLSYRLKYWSDIKDVIIPFIQLLSNKYDMTLIYLAGSVTNVYDYEDIIEDKIPNDIEIYTLSFHFKIID